MGQSLVQNYIHIIFSTKYRTPFIQPPVEAQLHAYLAGISRNLQCPALKVGGYTDHIHLLCRLSQTIALMKLIEELKRSSSKWMKKQGEDYKDFYWQDGYGAFSVSPKRVDYVITYIENQHIHHQTVSFQDEYRSILKAHNIDYDEKYIWD